MKFAGPDSANPHIFEKLDDAHDEWNRADVVAKETWNDLETFLADFKMSSTILGCKVTHGFLVLSIELQQANLQSLFVRRKTTLVPNILEMHQAAVVIPH